MALTIKFKYEPGQTVYFTGLDGIHSTVIQKVTYNTESGLIRYTIANGLTVLNEEQLFSTVKEVKRNIKLIEED